MTAPQNVTTVPRLLTVPETAECLRTTTGAVYQMVARGQLPGVIRLGGRVLVREDDLIQWLNHNRTPSPKE